MGERRVARGWSGCCYWLRPSTLCGYVLRWYVGGRVPLSNGYETMLFMALCILVLACLLVRRFPFVLPFGFLLSGCALLVAHIGQLNPQITPLMPVLVSPWLSAHVSFIMMAYALLSFLVLNGVLALFLLWRRRRGGGSGVDGRVEQLTLLSRLLLYPAVFLLGAGIFLGAVWGQRVVGTLLGVGPQGGVGVGNVHGLRSGFPWRLSAGVPPSGVLPCLDGTCLSRCADDLLRGELLPGGYAQLCGRLNLDFYLIVTIAGGDYT